MGSWTKIPQTLARGTEYYWESTFQLPGGIGLTTYSNEIQFVGPLPNVLFGKVLIVVLIDGLVGTNIDVSLLGAGIKNGTKRTHIAALVTALTDTTPVGVLVDLNDFCDMVYYIGALADADNSANNMTVRIYKPQ